jgi:hypothetical protein
MTEATTIKVPRRLRDRIKADAASRGVTAAALIGELLDRYEREARMAAVARAYAGGVDADYASESAAWDDAAERDGADE